MKMKVSRRFCIQNSVLMSEKCCPGKMLVGSWLHTHGFLTHGSCSLVLLILSLCRLETFHVIAIIIGAHAEPVKFISIIYRGA